MIENFLAGSSALLAILLPSVFCFWRHWGDVVWCNSRVSMLTLAAILLPFTAGLEPAQGVMLFVIYCTGTYGGAITAILLISCGRQKTRQLLLTAIL